MQYILNRSFNICLILCLCIGSLIYFTACKKIPTAAFTASSLIVAPGESVQFTDLSLNSPTNWIWDFGDGTTSTNQNPSHSYMISGSYTVTLTVTNSGGSDTETKANYIIVNIQTPVAAFTCSTTMIYTGETVTFTDQSINSPVTWSWNFGDGGTSESQNPSHDYTVVGHYTVTLTITNSSGSDTETKVNYITVNPTPAITNFSADPTTLNTGGIVTFTDKSTNNPTSWFWNFGDGETSTSQNPIHIYTAEGQYTVTLTVTTDSGPDTETKTNFITVNPHPPITFNPNLIYGSVLDIDGNTYKTIQIGTQTWMAENLKVSRYTDGTSIPLVTDNETWSVLNSPGYCWYENNEDYKNIYGALYNWYAISSTSNSNKNICPSGWHVPTVEEWTELTDFLGGENVAGGKLKETGIMHWISPNTGATNTSGFTAIPGGARSCYDGYSSDIGNGSYWWSTPEFSSALGWTRCVTFNNSDVTWHYNFKGHGLSVRCLRD